MSELFAAIRWVAANWHLALIIAGCLVGLFVLSKVKDIAGVPGLAVVGGLAVYIFGYMRGKRGESFNPIEQLPEDHKDAKPSFRRKPRPRTAKRSPVKPYEPPKGLT